MICFLQKRKEERKIRVETLESYKKARNDEQGESFVYFYFIVILYMCMKFYLCVSVHHVYAVFVDAKRGRQIS